MKHVYLLYKVSEDFDTFQMTEIKDCFDSYEKFESFAKKRGLAIGPKWRTQNKLSKEKGHYNGSYYFKIKKIKVN